MGWVARRQRETVVRRVEGGMTLSSDSIRFDCPVGGGRGSTRHRKLVARWPLLERKQGHLQASGLERMSKPERDAMRGWKVGGWPVGLKAWRTEGLEARRLEDGWLLGLNPC